MKYIQKHWFGLCVVIILFVAFLFRFYNYHNRWGLAYDQAHDALVARFALSEHKIPLVGPFSSAGPFQTGGEWYWFIMFATSFFPSQVMTPWIILTLFSLLMVYCLIRIGVELYGKIFGLIVGSIAAVSTAQIAQSTNLTNQSPLAFLSMLSIWSMVRFVRTKSSLYIFLLSFFVALAPMIHLQGVALIILLICTVLFTGIPSGRVVLVIFAGLAMPLLPILFFDIQHGFINSQNMMQYYLFDQYKMSFDQLGRRWLSYLAVFWPTQWAHIIGGEKNIGVVLFAGFHVSLLYGLVKKNMQKSLYILVFSLFGIIILLRYIRAPLFASYLVFVHPLIFIATGWLVFQVFQRKKIAGIFLLIVILIGSMSKNNIEMKGTNHTAVEATKIRRYLMEKFADKTFAVYDYKLWTVNKSFPISLYLTAGGKTHDEGYAIGIASPGAQLSYPIIRGGPGTGEYAIYDLSGDSRATLDAAGWALVNPSVIYEATEEWPDVSK